MKVFYQKSFIRCTKTIQLPLMEDFRDNYGVKYRVIQCDGITFLEKLFSTILEGVANCEI